MAKATGGSGGGSKFRATTTGGSISKLTESADGVDPFVQISYKSASSGGGSATSVILASAATRLRWNISVENNSVTTYGTTNEQMTGFSIHKISEP